jgi:hypothetical protein
MALVAFCCALGVSVTGLTADEAPARTDRLMWHAVRLDNEGKLLSWIETGSPYDQVVRLAWDAFKKVPVQPDGYRTYFTHPTFYGPNDPLHPMFSGRWWAHNPASLFAMLTDSAILYHAYSGDREVLSRVREMLDHHIAHGRTQPTDAWALVPYACGDAGDPRYQGATDTRYCYQEGNTPCGRGDGIGFLEPDKVGELGYAFLTFYKVTLERQYLEAALKCADALALNLRRADESHSPWPFRVDAKTGTWIRESYTANAIGPIRLLDELVRLKLGRSMAYRKARDYAWRWLMTYPVQNQVWTQYFEDVLIYPDYRFNVNQYSALETARYLLQHPERDHNSLAHAKRILDWVKAFFAADSVTMGGVPEKGSQYGADVVSEQVNDMDKMSSHTARYASVWALWSEATGDMEARERAYRSLNWATYSARENGLVKTSIDEGTGYWFSDGYGDYMRHFQRAMASVPEWAPADQDHLLGSSSVVREVRYGGSRLTYITFDRTAQEVLRLRRQPAAINCGTTPLKPVKELGDCREGYTIDAVESGGCVVRLRHCHSSQVTVHF